MRLCIKNLILEIHEWNVVMESRLEWEGCKGRCRRGIHMKTPCCGEDGDWRFVSRWGWCCITDSKLSNPARVKVWEIKYDENQNLRNFSFFLLNSSPKIRGFNNMEMFKCNSYCWTRISVLWTPSCVYEVQNIPVFQFALKSRLKSLLWKVLSIFFHSGYKSSPNMLLPFLQIQKNEILPKLHSQLISRSALYRGL